MYAARAPATVSRVMRGRAASLRTTTAGVTSNRMQSRATPMVVRKFSGSPTSREIRLVRVSPTTMISPARMTERRASLTRRATTALPPTSRVVAILPTRLGARNGVTSIAAIEIQSTGANGLGVASSAVGASAVRSAMHTMLVWREHQDVDLAPRALFRCVGSGWGGRTGECGDTSTICGTRRYPALNGL